ncbi:hypothetical protein [Kineosporia sp. A_224]|uniref:hypothetical protein n=1 Tax=Kineosporia sp. A_224 TaxID=1962180 RepID=UPI001179CEA3|nr:hypothetical protein [Kineosporia sp. A_224]
MAGLGDRDSAEAFRQDAHPVIGTVVESDQCFLCKSGPIVTVRYEHPIRGVTLARVAHPAKAYPVGTSLEVAYSDEPGADGEVVPASAVDDLGRGGGWFVAAGVSAFLAFLAWAFPANLRRLDRRDARTREAEEI